MAKLLAGTEAIRAAGAIAGFSVIDFWRWSASDLLSNATRGVFAEFLVAKALGSELLETRDEWAEWDVTTPEGIKVEVKTSAFIQSWRQSELSPPKFDVQRPRTRKGVSKSRPSNAYVFALLVHKDKATIDPSDLDQWEFFVQATRILDARIGDQKTISLEPLRKLCGGSVAFQGLRKAVADVVAAADFKSA